MRSLRVVLSLEVTGLGGGMVGVRRSWGECYSFGSWPKLRQAGIVSVQI